MPDPAPARTPARRATVAAYGLFAFALAEAVVAVGGAVVAGMSVDQVIDEYLLTNTVMGVAVLLCGMLIARHRPANPIGWLFLGFGLAHLTTAALTALGNYGTAQAWSLPLLRALATVEVAAWPLGIGLCLPLALQLFPDGRPVSRRWRPLVWLTVAAGAAFAAWLGTGPDVWFDRAAVRVESYLAFPANPVSQVLAQANFASLAVYLAVIASLVVRYVRGDDRIRRQLLWLVLAVIAVVVLNWQRWVLTDLSEEGILLLLAVPLIPLAVTVAILRHQLFDIRLVVSRTVLYGGLTGGVIAAYAGLVALLDGVLRGLGAPVLATLLIALAFNPARVWLQRAVDRAFYGAGRDPVRAVSAVGDRLAGDDLAGVVAGVREALRLPFAALRAGTVVAAWRTGSAEPAPRASSAEPAPRTDAAELAGRAGAGDGADNGAGQAQDVRVVRAASTTREVASSGTPPAALHVVPLVYRGERVGELVAGVRPGQHRLTSDDLAVLHLLATPLAVALHATALTEALQASRERLVSTAEEERRRLHRELHDSLGPTLTGAAFSADAIGNYVGTDPDRARAVSADLRSQVTAAIEDVRRLVYGLRPPALDDLGLVGALRRYASHLDRASSAHPQLPPRLQVTVTANEPLPALPAAVEVAAYRIATEALTNVVRHASARTAVVSLSATGLALRLSVDDDGAPGRLARGRSEPRGGSGGDGLGGDSWQPGVGLLSIVERAAELGGSCEAGPTPDGGRVVAVLPLGGIPPGGGA